MVDHKSMRVLSEEDITELKNGFARGEAPNDIATRMQLPAYRCRELRKQWKKDGTIAQPDTKPRGRPSKLPAEEVVYLRDFLDKFPGAFVREATDYLAFERGLDIDHSTVYRIMAKEGLIKKTPRNQDRTSLGMWKPSAPQDEDGRRIYGPVKDYCRLKYKSKDLNGRTKRQNELDEKVFDRVHKFVKEYMSDPRFDASHDYAHVMRVVHLAKHILKMERLENPDAKYDHQLVHLGALLHDIDDHKYPDLSASPPSVEQIPTPSDEGQGPLADPGLIPNGQQQTQEPSQIALDTSRAVIDEQDPDSDPSENSDDEDVPGENTRRGPNDPGKPSNSPHQPSKPSQEDEIAYINSTIKIDPHKNAIYKRLTFIRLPKRLIVPLCEICKSTSYTFETANPELASAALLAHPELGIIQDADRLDALGSIGVGRAFTYGGARAPGRGLDGTMSHFDDKLFKLEGLMKTAEGKRLARVRTERLMMFRQWWTEEMHLAHREEDYQQLKRSLKTPVRYLAGHPNYQWINGDGSVRGDRAAAAAAAAAAMGSEAAGNAEATEAAVGEGMEGVVLQQQQPQQHQHQQEPQPQFSYGGEPQDPTPTPFAGMDSFRRNDLGVSTNGPDRQLLREAGLL